MLERVMIIAGESSGELYGALLSGVLRSRNPELRIAGVGGDRMKSAGVELISEIASSFGLIEAVRTFGKIRQTFKKIVAFFTSFAPQVVVLIDYPDFNIPVAREAKKHGIKVFYYVSPQVWAWRTKRVATIAKLVDAMALILPFENDLYSRAGVHCKFVGHPIMDEIAEVTRNTDNSLLSIKTELGLQPDRPVVVLMPGSRPHEVQKLLPVMAGAAAALKERSPEYQFVLPVASNLGSDALAIMHKELGKFAHLSPVTTTQSIKALLSADYAVIASGTATLQAALLGVPMVVLYKLSPFTYFVGRLVVKVNHVSLVNILLDKSVQGDSGLRIRELLQGQANKKNVTEELFRISGDHEYRNAMISQMGKVRSLFLNRNASLSVAEMVENLQAGELAS
ncbi:MAG: lipid-A-disaccharide synthase [Nitrospirae bacterium]|nr:lipid-A-disaccharide synthase [Nitrospirota bacterium]